MTFTEPIFLWFIVLVFGLWWLCRYRERWAITLLLVGSLLFYGHEHWRLLPLLVLYCVVDWGVARWIERAGRPRLVLALGVGFNLAVLAGFKYTPLVAQTLHDLTGWPVALPSAETWSIPYGISFYAFTGIAYLVDVYRRTTVPDSSLARYTLSAAFFPHLVAGPILRADEFLNKLRPGQLPTEPLAPLEALQLLARGFFKKMVLADRIALAINPYFAHVADASTDGVWSLPYVYLYALQIYFDFSAYTDIARGLALLFGYRWPENFDRPYLAASVQEFWHRWHITLSRFLRDYLYIPLGGSRCGWWRGNLNLMLTMLLGGLWHGASWSFMLWGGLHGAFLVLHRVWCLCPLRDRLASLTGWAGWLWRVSCIVLTFQCICLAWCFFRLTTLDASMACVAKALTFDAGKMLVGEAAELSLWLALALYLPMTALADRVRRRLEAGGLSPAGTELLRGFAWSYGVLLIALAALLAPPGGSPAFIYFQF